MAWRLMNVSENCLSPKMAVGYYLQFLDWMSCLPVF